MDDTITMESQKIMQTVIRILIPVLLGLAVIGCIGISLSNNLTGIYWSLVSAYFFPPLGKESVIPAGIIAGINPLVMALSIAFVDAVVALFLVWNYDFAKKIPLIGTFMRKVENIGKRSSNKYAWISALRFIGIVLFVMVPFQGSGGLVGTIVGRFIGMKPWSTFCAICIGSLIGCTLIAYFAESIKTVFIQDIFIGLLILILLIIGGIMLYVYMRSKNKMKGNPT